MSRCISSEGEYSDHELATSGPAAERFTCRRCGALAEDELLAALDTAEATVTRVREARRVRPTDNVAENVLERIDAALDGTDETPKAERRGYGVLREGAEK